MAFLVSFVLCENTTEINLASFRRAIWLLAAPPFECLGDHRHTGGIGADVKNARIAGNGLRLPLLPALRGPSDALDHTLNLPCGDFDPCGLRQMPLGFEIGTFIRAS